MSRSVWTRIGLEINKHTHRQVHVCDLATAYHIPKFPTHAKLLRVMLSALRTLCRIIFIQRLSFDSSK